MAALTSPVIEWRLATSPFTPLSAVALSGSGYSGAIPIGTASTVATVRLYNNFSVAANVADATNCVLACYDDPIHQGTAVTLPSTQLYVQVSVVDYNGLLSGGDTSVFYAIGGQVKHALGVNGGTIAGSAPNYVTIAIQIVVPTNATQGSVSQGLWLEYNATA